MIHRYLRTVGLSQYQNREELNAFLDQLQESFLCFLIGVHYPYYSSKSDC